MLKQLILKNRSYRRFVEAASVSTTDLLDMIDNARLSASARNMQPLKYSISNSPEMNKQIFPCLAWAGYLKDWDGPAQGERPAAYIVVLHDKDIAPDYFCDDGISAQSILLTATEKGLGGCIIASVRRKELSEILKLSPHFEIIHVIALGKPAEKVVVEEVKGNDIRYWRDENSVHHVPKRSMKEIVINHLEKSD